MASPTRWTWVWVNFRNWWWTGRPKFSSVAQSCWIFATPRTATREASLSITNFQSLLKLMSIESVMPTNCLILCCPLLLPPSIFPSIRVFSRSQFFTSGGQSIGASASVLSMNIQDWFPLQLMVWSPCSPRDAQESSPAAQVKSIDSSVLSPLYGPTVTSVRDYWKKLQYLLYGPLLGKWCIWFLRCYLDLP